MAVLVTTQYIENYGVEEARNYWKFKGGSLFLVTGTDDRPANAMAQVAELMMYGSSGAIQFPTDWEVVEDDWKPENEWETVKHLVYEKDRKGGSLFNARGGGV